MSKKFISKELLTIISKAVEDKIYGSVEIYFEGGNITQITQRIINRVKKIEPKLTFPKIRVRINATKKTPPQIIDEYPEKRIESFN